MKEQQILLVNPSNLKHVDLNCPECHSNNILNDNHHSETYCANCGMVLRDSARDYTNIPIEKRVKFIRDLWQKKY